LGGVESYYDDKSPEYDLMFDTLYFAISDAITWRHLEPYLPRRTDTKILDAAGGTGRWSIRMAKEGCHVTLLDISEQMLDVARKKVEEEGLGHLIDIKKGEIRDTGYEDETFDMILCENALFLFERPDEIIREFSRMLKKGAPLVVSVPNLYVQCICGLPCVDQPSPEKLDDVLKILLREKYGSMADEGDVKIYTWTPGEFRILLEENGFRVDRIVGKGATMPLRLANEVTMARDYSEELFTKLLQLEIQLCERPDSLALAGHLQAVARRL